MESRDNPTSTGAAAADRGVTRRGLLRGAATGAGVALAGSGVAGAQQTATGTPPSKRPDWGGWLNGVDGGYRDARGRDQVTVRVGASGNGGSFAFEPAGLWVDPGTTVVFQWTGQGGGHNVVATSGPAAGGENPLDSGEPVAEAGATYKYTFEAGGITEYICEPHESLGMKGAVAVGGDVPTVAYEPPSTGKQEGKGGIVKRFAEAPPGSSVLLLIYAAVGLGALAVLGADYGGQFRQWRRHVESVEVSETDEREPEEPVEEIEHDEYDPTGTAALIVVYLAIISLMWVFMYFVEFLGRVTPGV